MTNATSSWLWGSTKQPGYLEQTKQIASNTKEAVTRSTAWKKASNGLSKAYEYTPPVRQWTATAMETAKNKPYHTAAVAVGFIATTVTSYMCIMPEEQPQSWCGSYCFY